MFQRVSISSRSLCRILHQIQGTDVLGSGQKEQGKRRIKAECARAMVCAFSVSSHFRFASECLAGFRVMGLSEAFSAECRSSFFSDATVITDQGRVVFRQRHFISGWVDREGV